jgi:hypothetical protein
VLLGWELECEPEREDGTPHVVWRRYTVSLHKKAEMRKTLEAWRGKNFTQEELDGFDLKNIAGKGCIITITHTEKDGQTYANIASVSALPKKMPAPTLSKPPTLFDVDEPDQAVFAAFSEKLQDLIRSSAEWQRRAEAGGEQPPPVGDDDIPF